MMNSAYIGMDVRTISVVAVVLGTAVFAIYEYFTTERNRQRQHQHAPPRASPPKERRPNITPSKAKRLEREESMQRKNETCTICLNTLLRGVVIGTVCDHQFHYKCLSDWHERNKACPICRRPITLGYSG